MSTVNYCKETYKRIKEQELKNPLRTPPTYGNGKVSYAHRNSRVVGTEEFNRDFMFTNKYVKVNITAIPIYLDSKNIEYAVHIPLDSSVSIVIINDVASLLGFSQYENATIINNNEKNKLEKSIALFKEREKECDAWNIAQKESLQKQKSLFE